MQQSQLSPGSGPSPEGEFTRTAAPWSLWVKSQSMSTPSPCNVFSTTTTNFGVSESTFKEFHQPFASGIRYPPLECARPITGASDRNYPPHEVLHNYCLSLIWVYLFRGLMLKSICLLNANTEMYYNFFNSLLIYFIFQ